MIPSRCNNRTPGLTLAHIQIIGFPWINRCSPFTARTPDCLHKIFLPLSSWNVFTGNNNSKIIAVKWTGNENELTKLAMNGIPTPCELNRSLIAQSLYRKGWTLLPFCLKHLIPVVFLTSCSLRNRVSHDSASSRAFHKLSVSPLLTVPTWSSCSRSMKFTWLRLALLEITHLMTQWQIAVLTASYKPCHRTQTSYSQHYHSNIYFF